MSAKGPAEINVTPLIDVLLVLLIIFLVMMPVMVRMENVALPPTVPDAEPGSPPIVLALHADLTVAIDDAPAVLGVQLAGQLARRLRPQAAVFLDVDDGVPWREVLATIDTVHAFTDVTVAVRMRPELEASAP